MRRQDYLGVGALPVQVHGSFANVLEVVVAGCDDELLGNRSYMKVENLVCRQCSEGREIMQEVRNA